MMVIDKNRTDFSDFLLEDEKIEEVEEFTYSGSIINTKCSRAKGIKRRISVSKSTVNNLMIIWKSRGISIGLKIRLLKSTAFAIALYKGEPWALQKQIARRSMHLRCDAREIFCEYPDRKRKQINGSRKNSI